DCPGVADVGIDRSWSIQSASLNLHRARGSERGRGADVGCPGGLRIVVGETQRAALHVHRAAVVKDVSLESSRSGGAALRKRTTVVEDHAPARAPGAADGVILHAE